MPIAPQLSLADRLKAQGVEEQSEILWHGPQDPGPLGGISQSMLEKFLECRERFRQKYIEGWHVTDRFNHTIEFGQMFHLAEESVGNGQPWQEPVHEYAAKLCQKYPMDQEHLNTYYQALLVQYPVYLDYWAKHEAPGEDAVPVFRERVFHEPYVLPSGRRVWLRGKGDGADSVAFWGGISYPNRATILHENKTKSEINQSTVEQRLAFDLQTSLYTTCLKLIYPDQEVVGVRYNVIKRPFSSGKGSIKQGEPKEINCPECGGKGIKRKVTCEECAGRGRVSKSGESSTDYYKRLQQYFIDAPGEWFARWNVTITSEDLASFQHKCLNPLLEQLCDWFNWITSTAGMKDPFQDSIHWQTPFGLWNGLRDGSGTTDYDSLLLDGSSVGLQRATILFRELA